MFEEKLEQFSTIRHCEILADQIKTINLLEINHDIFQQKLDELQEAYKELDDYELKYKELISSSSSADQLMLKIIRMTIQHIDKCHQEYLNKEWRKLSFTQKSFMLVENLYRQFVRFLKMLGNWIKSIGKNFAHKVDELFIKKSSSIITLVTETIESKIHDLRQNDNNNNDINTVDNNNNNNNNINNHSMHQRNYSVISTMSISSSSSSLSSPSSPSSILTTSRTTTAADSIMSSSFSSSSSASLDETSSLLTSLTTYSDYDLKHDDNYNNYDDENRSINDHYDYNELDDEFYSQNIFHVDTVLQSLKLEYLLNLRFYKIFIDQMLFLQSTDLDQNNNHQSSSFKLLDDITDGYRKIINSFESLEDEISQDYDDNCSLKGNNFDYKKNKIKYSKLSSEFVGFTPADWYLVVLINITGKYINGKLDDLMILENKKTNSDDEKNGNVDDFSQVEVIKDLFKEIERLKDLFVE